MRIYPPANFLLNGVMLLTPIANLQSPLCQLTPISFLGLNKDMTFLAPVSLHILVIGLLRTLSVSFCNSLSNPVGISLVAGYRILYFLVCSVG